MANSTIGKQQGRQFRGNTRALSNLQLQIEDLHEASDQMVIFSFSLKGSQTLLVSRLQQFSHNPTMFFLEAINEN
jgi:hypothetical protein